MKRLLAQIGITYFSVLAVAFYLSDTAVLLIGGISLVIFLVFIVVKKTRKTIFLPAMAIAAAVGCAVNIGYSVFFVNPVIERYGGGEHTVAAVLEDEPYKSYSKYYYRLRTTRIDGESADIRLLLKSYAELDAEPDDILTFTSELDVIENDYYCSKGFFLISDSFDTVVDVEPAASHSLYHYAVKLRQYMRKALDAYLPSDCASLCRAVLIGDKYALDQEVRDDFRYAGASYFIVVSGMHFAVICMLLLRLFKKIPRIPRFVLMLLFMLLYAAITGFQPSVLRSGLMMVFAVAGLTFRRQAYPPNHLGIAGVILPFIVSPYGAGDIGLILSFYATLAILLWAEPIAKKLCFRDEFGNILRFGIGVRLHEVYAGCKERVADIIKAIIKKEKPKQKQKRRRREKAPFDAKVFLKKLWNCIGLMLSVSLAANILVFPISVFAFHEFSLVALLSAVLLYWEIYLILLLSFAVCILYWIPPLRFAALLLSWPLYFFCRLVLLIVSGIGSLPFAYYRVGEGWFYVWVVLYLVFGAAVLLYRNNYRYLKLAAFCLSVILLAGILSDELVKTQILTLEVYSCGNGLCAAVNSGGRLHLLHTDARSKYIYSLLDDLSVRFGKAESALCSDKAELRNATLYEKDEFAIDTVLMYDIDGKYKDFDNVTAFDDDSVFVTDDDVVIRAAVSGDTVIPYITAGDRNILIVPDSCSFDSIPADMRQADIIVLSAASAGMENLRCESLIISDSSDFALRTADAMKGCYQQVYFTDKGDVALPLR